MHPLGALLQRVLLPTRSPARLVTSRPRCIAAAHTRSRRAARRGPAAPGLVGGFFAGTEIEGDHLAVRREMLDGLHLDDRRRPRCGSRSARCRSTPAAQRTYRAGLDARVRSVVGRSGRGRRRERAGDVGGHVTRASVHPTCLGADPGHRGEWAPPEITYSRRRPGLAPAAPRRPDRTLTAVKTRWVGLATSCVETFLRWGSCARAVRTLRERIQKGRRLATRTPVWGSERGFGRRPMSGWPAGGPNIWQRPVRRSRGQPSARPAHTIQRDLAAKGPC